MSYNLSKHKHLFSAWAASTAASSSKKLRFTIERGITALEHAGFPDDITNKSVPMEKKKFDEWHKNKCSLIIISLKDPQCSYGIAAKLINVYLKAFLVCDESTPNALRAIIHPPIDRVLLKGLMQNSKNINDGNYLFWRDAMNGAWSTYSKERYFEVINKIHLLFAEGWLVEEFWGGHQ
ncbi:MAG: hypothetical protein H8D23_39390 [Candidatus Brocadiales bacterium]|nr:hypothetical protein [Candidatus Brocadiales bacterium]